MLKPGRMGFVGLVLLGIFVVRNLGQSSLTTPATLDAIKTCTTDNWGMPHQKRHPYRTTYQTQIQKGCRAQLHKDRMRPISQALENATVNHYLSNQDFDAFKGIDLVPDNHKLYTGGSMWGNNLEYKHVRRDYMRAATCETQQEDGSTWTVTKIGPMRTRGGYDWVQVGWDNLWDFRSKLKEHPHGIYVLEQFSGPVTADGTRLGHPPIHIHHIHVGPAPGVRQRADTIGCVFQGKKCYDPTRVFEHHGDYQCTSVPDGTPQIPDDGEEPGPDAPMTSGGLDCLTESVPDGYGKLITQPLGLEGDINDVRAPNSTVLEWYYQLGARWVPKLECSEYPEAIGAADDDDTAEAESSNAKATTEAAAVGDKVASDTAATAEITEGTAKPTAKAAKKAKKKKAHSAVFPRPKAMSFHNFAGPGDLNLKQSSFVFTYQSPTDAESIFWYTGRMHHSGTMLRLKQHAHNIIFRESIFFAASPEQLGLTKANKLVPDVPYHVVRAKEAGFASNEEVKRFILSALERSQDQFAAEQIYTGRRSLRSVLNLTEAQDGTNPVPDAGPRAICHAIESTEEVDGFHYDRREPTCCVPWTFQKGDIFTVVGFNKIVTERGTGPHQGNRLSIPPTFPGHIGWWISFDSHEVPEQSHYSLVQYTNNPDVQFQDFANIHEDIAMFLLSGGTAYDPDSWTYAFFRSLVFLYHHPILLPMMVVAAVLMVRLLRYLHSAVAFVVADGELEMKAHMNQD